MLWKEKDTADSVLKRQDTADSVLKRQKTPRHSENLNATPLKEGNKKDAQKRLVIYFRLIILSIEILPGPATKINR